MVREEVHGLLIMNTAAILNLTVCFNVFLKRVRITFIDRKRSVKDLLKEKESNPNNDWCERRSMAFSS